MKYTRQIWVGLSTVLLLFAAAMSYAQLTTPEPEMVNVSGRMMRAMVGGMQGRKLGQPALILEADAGAGLDEWSRIFADLARLAPVVAHDRRGLWRSEIDTQPQNYRRVAQSLHELLTAIRIPPPYILVGHSVGSMYIRGFSDMFPQEVVGYVYDEAFDFDGTPEEKAAAFPEAERAQALAPPALPPVPPDTPPGLLAEIDFLKGEMLSGGGEGRRLQQKAGVPVAVIVAARGCPRVDVALHPGGNGDRAHVSALADQIGNHPVFFALLDGSRRRPNNSARRQPQPISIAIIAWSRNSRAVDGIAHSSSRRPCSGVSQFPRRTPIRRPPSRDEYRLPVPD